MFTVARSRRSESVVAETGMHIWANRFERRLADIFDLQDEITESIVGAVEPEILSAEMRRARGKRPDSLAAYDCVLRAYQHVFNLTLEDNDKALDFLRQAIRLALDYASAYAYASWAHLFRRGLETPSADLPKRAWGPRHAALNATEPRRLKQ
jgi:adenylate cyclase